MQNLKSKHRGDQYVEVKIVMPDNIDDKDKEIYEELAKANPYDPRKELSKYMK